MPPSYSPCPRPILKRPNTEPPLRPVPSPYDEPTQLLAIDPGVLQPLVHFAPKPTLSHTFSAYSSATYDRSPIVVAPNRCALPERGCPGRTYTIGDPDRINPSSSSSSSPSSRSRQRSPTGAGRHLHPRAGFAPEARYDDDDEDEDPTPKATPLAFQHPLPPLIPDLSSESDDSDGFISPPTAPSAQAAAYTRTGLAIPHAKSVPPELGLAPPMGAALAFLPHPHPARRTAASPTRASTAHPPEEERGARHRTGASRARSPSRRRHAAGSPEHGRYKAFSERSSLNGCSLPVPDQGCFGGF